MPGTLYVVATPIGNLEDVTFRALRVLREVSLIAAEDTRRTSRLLQHYSISTPTTSLHEHNERAKTAGLIRAPAAAANPIALVSDAGTPVVSDPGARLVAAAHAAGIRVEPIPGTERSHGGALRLRVRAATQFVFLGFPPARRQARRTWLGDPSRRSARPFVIYTRHPTGFVTRSRTCAQILGDRTVAVGRELTKIDTKNWSLRPISEHLS